MLKTIHIGDPSQLSGKQLLVSWPGHQMTLHLLLPVLRLGRYEQDNDIIIQAAVVSRYHATLQREGASYRLIDGQMINGEHRPSANGLYIGGKRITSHQLAHGDIIRIPGENENFITLTYFDEESAQRHDVERILLSREIRIGRARSNQLTLPDPLVSGSHAIIQPSNGGHLLQDLNSSNGTYVNGQRIRKATLQAGDIIQIGSIRFQYTGSELVQAADLRREGIRIDALELRKQVKFNKSQPDDPDLKVLIDDISLSIQPREFVAIVGGSGTGKSTMLDALNGFRPAQGQVLLNGDNLYQNFDAYRHTIGYVPQDDIIHRELTVEEALRYVARLRLPADTAPEEIEDRIDAALEQMAMTERKRVLIKLLSGGQRKRVSIAVELIADPGIVFLDEPTSGLDPGLDKKMMFTLRQVANAGKTVILVTHATGNIVECHLVIFLAAGGRLVFFGPPTEALAFFGVNDFAEIYNLVEQEPETWIQTYRTSPYYEQYIKQRLHCNSVEQQSVTPTTQASGSLFNKLTNFARQVRILSDRYLTLQLRDRRNLLFLLLQAPVIGVLLLFVTESGLFEKGLDTTAKDVADIQKLLFVMACSATWFGVINSVREIVKELPIYRRERLVNLGITAYVFSKLIVLFGLGLLQALALVVIVSLQADFPWQGVIMLGSMEIFITATLVTFASACFGLFLSAIAEREDRVMSIMPLFLIPQIVFAGVVFTLEGVTRFISAAIFTRWGIEALGATVNLPDLAEKASFSGPVQDLVFDFTYSTSYLLQKWLILLGFAVLSIILTILALKRQDVT